MAVCDICSTPGVGTVISAEDMRYAVFKNGFNPLSLGLVKDPMALMNKAEWYNGWKNTIVAQDTSDWNICPNCMAKLKSYLKGTPMPTGVRKATVSANPLVSTLAGAATEQKYKKGKKEGVAGESAQPKRLGGCLLISSGLLLLAVSLISVAATVAIFLDPALVEDDTGSVFLGSAICTLPILICGFVLLLFGIRKLRGQRKQIAAAPADIGFEGIAVGGPSDHLQGTKYQEGDIVKCGVCGKSLRVKYHDPGKLTLATADALKGVALRCQTCGFIVCDPCSMPPGGVGTPICPNCKAIAGGPYLFVHE